MFTHGITFVVTQPIYPKPLWTDLTQVNCSAFSGLKDKAAFIAESIWITEANGITNR